MGVLTIAMLVVGIFTVRVYFGLNQALPMSLGEEIYKDSTKVAGFDHTSTPAANSEVTAKEQLKGQQTEIQPNERIETYDNEQAGEGITNPFATIQPGDHEEMKTGSLTNKVAKEVKANIKNEMTMEDIKEHKLDKKGEVPERVDFGQTDRLKRVNQRDFAFTPIDAEFNARGQSSDELVIKGGWHGRQNPNLITPVVADNMMKPEAYTQAKEQRRLDQIPRPGPIRGNEYVENSDRNGHSKSSSYSTLTIILFAVMGLVVLFAVVGFICVNCCYCCDDAQSAALEVAVPSASEEHPVSPPTTKSKRCPKCLSKIQNAKLTGDDVSPPYDVEQQDMNEEDNDVFIIANYTAEIHSPPTQRQVMDNMLKEAVKEEKRMLKSASKEKSSHFRGGISTFIN